MSNDKSNPAWWNAKYSFLRVTNNSVYPWLTEENSWAEDIPVGWRNSFFEDMCDELTDVLGEHVGDFEIVQLKEKYGSMRLYWGWKDESLSREESNVLSPKVDAVLNKYEHISITVCACCGAPATHMTEPWILYMCDTCYKMHKYYFAI